MRLDGADFLFNLIVAGARMSTELFSLTCLILWNHPEAGQAFILMVTPPESLKLPHGASRLQKLHLQRDAPQCVCPYGILIVSHWPKKVTCVTQPVVIVGRSP